MVLSVLGRPFMPPLGDCFFLGLALGADRKTSDTREGSMSLMIAGRGSLTQNRDCEILAEVTGQTILEDIYKLRVTAWREKMAIPSHVGRWKEATDDVARHWAILMGNIPIAAARLSIHSSLTEVPDSECLEGVLASLPAPICSINRCVVHPDYWGMGFARKLDKVRLDTARQLGCKSIVATVSDAKRAKTLASYGFRYVGDGLPYPKGIVKGDLNIVYVLNLH